jgi:hypothetical protein
MHDLTMMSTLMRLLPTLLFAVSVSATAHLPAHAESTAGSPRLPAFERLPGPEPEPTAPGLPFSPPTDNTAALAAESPVVFEHTADAGPDQTFFLTGERLGKEVFAWGRGAGTSGGEASKVRFLAGTTDWLTANLDITAYNGPFLVWVRNDTGWSRPIRLNAPEVWWCWPAKPTPGQTLRIFGRDLAQRPDRTTAHVWLNHPGQQGQWLALQKAGKYELNARMPRDLAAGSYQLWVHAGHGGRYGWSEPLAIEVAKPVSVPVREVALSPESRQAGSQNLNATLEQLSRKGGGVLRLAPGEYFMKETLKVPANTILRGAGCALSRITFLPSGGDAYERTPTIPSSRPFAAGEPVPRERPTTAVWLAGDQAAIEDVTIAGNTETSNGIVVASPEPLTWLEGCRIERCRVAELEGVEQEISAIHLFRSSGAIVRSNELYGRVLVDLSGVKHSLIASNVLVPVLRYGSRFKETAEGAIQDRNEVLESCIIEHNFARAPQGAEAGSAQTRRLLWVSTGRGSVTHNWFGGNSTSEPGSRVSGPVQDQMQYGAAAGHENQNVGEIILFEANQRTLYFGPVLKAGAAEITLPDQAPPTPDNQLGTVTRKELEADGRGTGALVLTPNVDDGSTEPPVTEYYVTIVQGAGHGQTRRVSARAGSVFRLDRPWRTPPRAGSLVIISTAFFQNHIVGNSVADGMAGIQLWIGCSENIIAANTMRRSRGSGLFLFASASTMASSMPRTWNAGLSACFFNSLEGNWTETCVDGMLLSAGEEARFRPDFPRTMGTVVRHNTFLANRGHAFVISGGSAGPPALLGTIVEQNFARDMQTGFASGSGSDGVVFRRNHAYFWHGQAGPNSRTAFRFSRPGGGTWVDENTVEGVSAGGHDGIRLLDKPQ